MELDYSDSCQGGGDNNVYFCFYYNERRMHRKKILLGWTHQENDTAAYDALLESVGIPI